MAGNALLARRTVQPEHEQPPLTHDRMIYHPDDIMRMQQFWRDNHIIQSEDGRYFIDEHQPPPNWRPWWAER